MWNKLKIHVFGNVPFLHIVWYSCVFSILKPKKPEKTLILHVHRNVLSFPHIVYFPCILVFLYVISSTLKIHVFRKVIQLYLNKRDFCMRFIFLVRKLKNTKMTRFSQCCFVFSYRVISMIFSVLVNNTLINTQKTGFWKSRFFSPLYDESHLFWRFVPNNVNTLKIHVFGNVVLFFHVLFLHAF